MDEKISSLFIEELETVTYKQLVNVRLVILYSHLISVELYQRINNSHLPVSETVLSPSRNVKFPR